MLEYIISEELEVEIPLRQVGKILNCLERITLHSPNFPPCRIQYLSKDNFL